MFFLGMGLLLMLTTAGPSGTPAHRHSLCAGSRRWRLAPESGCEWIQSLRREDAPGEVTQCRTVINLHAQIGRHALEQLQRISNLGTPLCRQMIAQHRSALQLLLLELLAFIKKRDERDERALREEEERLGDGRVSCLAGLPELLDIRHQLARDLSAD